MAAGKLPAYRRRLCTVKHCEPRLCGTHLEVLFVVLRDEGRRHLLKAVPKHFRSRMRLALNSRPWALVWLCSRLHRCRITTLFAAYFSAAVVLPCG